MVHSIILKIRLKLMVIHEEKQFFFFIGNRSNANRHKTQYEWVTYSANEIYLNETTYFVGGTSGSVFSEGV